MGGYHQGDSLVHRLDPRTKLAIQIAFVAAAYAHTEPIPLTILSGVTAAALWLADLRVRAVLSDLRYLIAFLAMAPVLAGAQLGSPWIDPLAAVDSGLSAYRVLLIVVLSLGLVRTTAPREARAAITSLIPGRFGRGLGTGVGLVFRFLPLLRVEALRTRDAMRTRLAERRPLHERIQLLVIVVFARMLQRADRVTLGLRARCLAWNPTSPGLTFTLLDLPAGVVAATLLLWALV